MGYNNLDAVGYNEDEDIDFTLEFSALTDEYLETKDKEQAKIDELFAISAWKNSFRGLLKYDIQIKELAEESKVEEELKASSIYKTGHGVKLCENET